MTATLRPFVGHTAPRVPSLPSLHPSEPAAPATPRTFESTLTEMLERMQHASPTALTYVSTWQPVREDPALACALLRCAGSLRLQDGELAAAHLVRWSYPLAILLTTMPSLQGLITANGQTVLEFAARRYPDVATLAAHLPR